MCDARHQLRLAGEGIGAKQVWPHLFQLGAASRTQLRLFGRLRLFSGHRAQYFGDDVIATEKKYTYMERLGALLYSANRMNTYMGRVTDADRHCLDVLRDMER